MVNYKDFRLKRINDPRFRHLWLLLFWAFFGLWFLLAERFIPMTYHPVGCFLDSRIPFCEWFILPYVLWYGFVAGPVLVLLLTDVDAFRKMMGYIILTYGVVMVIYTLYPTSQSLRPTEFPRDNVLTQAVQFLYRIDTPTNVCPSLHVVGSIGAACGWWAVKGLRKWRWLIVLLAFFISISTVFIKQHSLVDVATGALLCLIAYPIVYRRKK